MSSCRSTATPEVEHSLSNLTTPSSASDGPSATEQQRQNLGGEDSKHNDGDDAAGYSLHTESSISDMLSTGPLVLRTDILPPNLPKKAADRPPRKPKTALVPTKQQGRLRLSKAQPVHQGEKPFSKPPLPSAAVPSFLRETASSRCKRSSSLSRGSNDTSLQHVKDFGIPKAGVKLDDVCVQLNNLNSELYHVRRQSENIYRPTGRQRVGFAIPTTGGIEVEDKLAETNRRLTAAAALASQKDQLIEAVGGVVERAAAEVSLLRQKADEFRAHFDEERDRADKLAKELADERAKNANFSKEHRSILEELERVKATLAKSDAERDADRVRTENAERAVDDALRRVEQLELECQRVQSIRDHCTQQRPVIVPNCQHIRASLATCIASLKDIDIMLDAQTVDGAHKGALVERGSAVTEQLSTAASNYQHQQQQLVNRKKKDIGLGTSTTNSLSSNGGVDDRTSDRLVQLRRLVQQFLDESNSKKAFGGQLKKPIPPAFRMIPS